MTFRVQQIVLSFLGLSVFSSVYSQEYYPEYKGDHRTAYVSVHVGQSRAIGAYKSNSYAGNGLALALNKGGNPIVGAYRFLGPTKLRLAYEYGTSLSAQRIDIDRLNEDHTISPIDTTRYFQLAGGGSLRLIYPIGKQVVIELRGGLYLTNFITPNHYTFFYHTDNGREEIITTFERRGQFQIARRLGFTARYWNIGLNVEYNWFRYDTKMTTEAVNSEITSTIDFNGVVQHVRVMVAYYFPR